MLFLIYIVKFAFSFQDETPLFLAAREGSYQACKALLEAYANREITDHMDRLPRDVASERLHHDIVRLLEEHVPRSPQMVNVIPNNSMMSKYYKNIFSCLFLLMIYSATSLNRTIQKCILIMKNKIKVHKYFQSLSVNILRIKKISLL